jgi:sporulation protein YlmC with PRC-barrel domain
MLRLGELIGRAVVDMDAAEKVGEIDEIVLDPDQCMVAGLVLVHGKSILGSGTYRVIPATLVHSIGGDAATFSGSRQTATDDEMPGLPRRRDVVGRKVVGQSGDFFGQIEDVLIDPADGRIIGYELGQSSAWGGLENLFGGSKARQSRYVRAEADLRVGSEIVVVPDEAVVDQADTASSDMSGVAPPPAGGWGQGQASNVGRSVWRPPDRGRAAVGGRNPEPRRG